MVNGVPTLAILLCFNKWARPVAPLVLGFVTAAVSGALVAYLGLFSSYGFEAAVGLAVFLNLHPGWLVAGTILLSSAIFGMIGWALARQDFPSVPSWECQRSVADAGCASGYPLPAIMRCG